MEEGQADNGNNCHKIHVSGLAEPCYPGEEEEGGGGGKTFMLVGWLGLILCVVYKLINGYYCPCMTN